MSFETLSFSHEGGVATITLTRPKAANTITPQVADELVSVAETCRDNPEIRAVILASEGPIFSAGGDLAGFASEGDNLPKVLAGMVEQLHRAVELFASMDPPVIAVVNGMAAGAGFSLAMMCNFVLATEKAGFTVAYTGAGLTPDGSSTYFLPRLVGFRRAEELMVTNRRLTAEEAADWGIVNRVVPEAEIMAEAQKMAARLAKGPTVAFGNVRKLLLESFDSELADQMKKEGESIVAMSASADGREGISAFIEKRKPNFSGQA